MRRALQVVILVFSLTVPAVAHLQDWSVYSGAERAEKLIHRYLKLLRAEPNRPLILRRLVETTGRGPALERLVEHQQQVTEISDRVNDWIVLGHLLSAAERAGEARVAFESAVARGPNSPAAHLALGRALVEGGEPKLAEAHFEKSLELSSSPRLKRALLRRLVDQAMLDGRPGRAVRWLEKLIEIKPRDADLRREIAQALRRIHRHDEALEHYAAALGTVGRNGKLRAEILQEMGTLHRDMKDLVAAEKSLRQALSLVGRNSWMRREILMRLVDVARDGQRLPEVYAELINEWRPPSYTESMTLAGLAEELGRHDDAINWFERAIRTNRKSTEARTRLIARLERSGQHDRIRELYDELVKLSPRDAARRIERAEWLFFTAREAPLAMRELRAVEANHHDPEALAEVARAWSRFGLPDEAIRIHEKVLAASPEDIHNVETYGELLYKSGRQAAANEMLAKLLDSDLGALRARLRLADIYGRLGARDRVIVLLEEAVELAPEMPDVRQRLAGAYERDHRWAEAIEQWETLFLEHEVSHAGPRLIQLAEKTRDKDLLARWEKRHAAESTVRLGYVLARLRLAVEGRMGTGYELLAKIAALDPRELPASDHTSWLAAADDCVREFLRNQEPLEAIALLKRIADRFGERRLGAWQRIADLATAPPLTGDMAHTLLRQAVAAIPNSSHAHAQLAYFLASTERQTEAIHHFDRAVRLGTTNFDVHLDLVYHLDATDQPNRARAVLLEIIRRDTSGRWASGAAFSALDRCKSDDDLARFHAQLVGLEHRIEKKTYREIMVATYQQLFAYSDDPGAMFDKLGHRALPILVEALNSPSEDVRGRAMSLLSLYPPKRVAKIAGKAWDDEATWQPEAMWAMARAGHADGRRALIDGLDSPRYEVREVAIFAAGQQRIEEALPKLIEILGSDDRTMDERILSATALGRFDDVRATRALVEMTVSAAPTRLRPASIWALAAVDAPRATNHLVRLLSDPSESARRAAAAALAQHRTSGALRAQLTAYWSDDSRLASAARRSLEVAAFEAEAVKPDIGADIPDLADLVERQISDSVDRPPLEPVVRKLARYPTIVADVVRGSLKAERGPRVLEDLVLFADLAGPGDEDAMKSVVDELRPDLRELTLTASPPSAIPAAKLLPLSRNPDDVPVVLGAIPAFPSNEADDVIDRMSSYDWGEVHKHVETGLNSGDAGERATSLKVLGRMGKPADASQKLLVRLADDEDLRVRIAAIDALGALRVESATAPLVEVFERRDETTRAAVMRALQRIDTPEAKKAVVKLLTVPIRRPCRGDQEDLSALLRDDCLGVFDAEEF